jgi:hypothetical protein
MLGGADRLRTGLFAFKADAMQVPPEPLSGFAWFIDKATGQLAGAGFTAIVTLVVLWIKRSRPGRVVVRTEHYSSLLEIGDRVRPRLVATFDQSVVRRLTVAVYSVANETSSPLTNASIQFAFPVHTRVLSWETKGVPEAYCVADSDRSVTLHIPLFNSTARHGDRVLVELVFDNEGSSGLTLLTVLGRGHDWSAVHLYSFAQAKAKIRKLVAVCLALGACSTFVYIWLEAVFPDLKKPVDIGFAHETLQHLSFGITVTALSLMFGSIRFLRVQAKRRGPGSSPFD